MTNLTIDDFRMDAPTSGLIKSKEIINTDSMIHGVTLTGFNSGTDKRGQLSELLSTRSADVELIVHVYQVRAASKSVRAWVLHKFQDDRLAFTMGHFRVVLFDLRTDSPTYRQLNVFDLGENRQALLRIPSFVVHGVQNVGIEMSSFVNLPTRVYDPANPDKWRIPANHPGVPYQFDFG